MSNDLLMQMWSAGAISVQQLLENGDFPFADQLLQSIKAQQEQIENGQTPDGLSPQLAEQVQQEANMEAVQQGQQMLQG